MGLIPRSDELIDRWLGLEGTKIGQSPQFRHRTTIEKLSASPFRVRGFNLVQELLNSVQQACQSKLGSPGKDNFAFRHVPLPRSGRNNVSPEVTLERAIVGASSETNELKIGNMMPVASGVFSLDGNKRAAVDLVEHSEREGLTCLEMIELKVGRTTNTPLFAAFEILGYGLCYVMARAYPNLFGCSHKTAVLSADRVQLVVLAPRSYFSPERKRQIKWLLALEDQVNKELHHLDKPFRYDVPDYELHFQFKCFPDEFSWNPAVDSGPAASQKALAAFQERQSFRAAGLSE